MIKYAAAGPENMTGQGWLLPDPDLQFEKQQERFKGTLKVRFLTNREA